MIKDKTLEYQTKYKDLFVAISILILFPYLKINLKKIKLPFVSLNK